MKSPIIHSFGLCVLCIVPVLCLAEPETARPPSSEPNLYHHFLSMKRMQEGLPGRSLEEQARLQPHIHRAERKACERLMKDRRERVPKEHYRQQGGDEFLVFAQQFEQYCATIQ
jgi:hypothetical protein